MMTSNSLKGKILGEVIQVTPALVHNSNKYLQSTTAKTLNIQLMKTINRKTTAAIKIIRMIIGRRI